MSKKSTRKDLEGSQPRQTDVRKRGKGVSDRWHLKTLRDNLGRLVGSLSTGGKVAAYEQIAMRMSALAGLEEGHEWTWRYVSSFHTATIEPSKKFLRVLALLLADISPRQKQWFYFARYHSLVAVFDKSVRREMIADQMKRLGYKPVAWKRYAQLKRGAIKRKTHRKVRR